MSLSFFPTFSLEIFSTISVDIMYIHDTLCNVKNHYLNVNSVFLYCINKKRIQIYY